MKGHSKKRKVAYIAVGSLLAVGLFAALVYSFFMPTPVDSVYEPKQAEALVEKYYKDQASALGLNANQNTIARSCYKYQPIGGVWENIPPGLWCQASIKRTITNIPDLANTGKLFDEINLIAKRDGLDPGQQPGQQTYAQQASKLDGSQLELMNGQGNEFELSCSVHLTSDYVIKLTNGGYQFQPLNSLDAHANPYVYYELTCRGAASKVPPGYTGGLSVDQQG